LDAVRPSCQEVEVFELEFANLFLIKSLLDEFFPPLLRWKIFNNFKFKQNKFSYIFDLKLNRLVKGGIFMI